MIDIKTIAADIAQELRKHPERWTQDVQARRADGRAVFSDDSTAVSFCLAGHIRRRYGEDPEGYTGEGPCMRFARMALANGWDGWGASQGAITGWNDAPYRTVADVIALCERVAGHAPGCERGTEP